MENPFVYGEVVPAASFVDRVDELDRLVRDLGSGQKVFLISPRRYGKSSLIRQALRANARSGALTAEVTVSSYSSYLAFLEGYTRALMTMQTGLDKARSWLREAIGAAKPELRLEADSSGLMGVSVKFPTVRTDKDLSRLAAEVFALPLSLARRVKDQRQRERGRKVYSLHAPEVECIGKGKAHKPYEFGVKVSVATPLYRCRGGQFVAHVKALPGNPYDGHTLAVVVPAIESTIGAALERIVTDAGYKGHNAPKDQRFKVYVAGQKRGLTAAVKRAFRRRSAVEPTIGHLKNEHRMGRNYLAGRAGDAVNAVLAAAGYNFRLLLRWLALLLQLVLATLMRPSHANLTRAQP